MKKRYFIIPLFTILFITIGFSAFTNNLQIDGISLVVRKRSNIRVTNVYYQSSSNNGVNNNINYNISNINGSVTLPNSNSSVTYTVTITNIGNVKKGISSINLPSNLAYDINGYTVGNKLCDSTNSNNCTNGSITTFNITIKYKSGQTASNNPISFICEFDIKDYYDIQYLGFSSTTGLETGIMVGETRSTTFTSTTGIPYAIDVLGATPSYNNPTLTLNNPTSDITIKRKYSITYVDFTGSTSGLPNSILYSGGNITFNNTSGIPDSVTITGGTGDYTNSPVLSISSITGNITITGVFSTPAEPAYITIQNIYNNNTPSEDQSCENTILPDDSDDANLRYVGSTPCNYIYFNNSNWRIIGIFNVNGENLIKIINPTTYSSNTAFHNKNKKNFEKWPASALAQTLNSTFYNQIVTNGYGDYIKSVTWNVGQPSGNTVTPKTFYDAEVAIQGDSSANVGLLNVSDILYATSGPTNGDRTTACLNTKVYGYDSSIWSRTGCISNNAIVNDWLYSGNNEWTLDTSAGSSKVYRMQNNGIPALQSITNTTTYTRTVVYLKENITFTSGNGSSSTNGPYQISLIN